MHHKYNNKQNVDFVDKHNKYKVDFVSIYFMLLLFKVLLFLFMGFFFSRTQLLSLNRTSILFLPPDGTLKIK